MPIEFLMRKLVCMTENFLLYMHRDILWIYISYYYNNEALYALHLDYSLDAPNDWSLQPRQPHTLKHSMGKIELAA